MGEEKGKEDAENLEESSDGDEVVSVEGDFTEGNGEDDHEGETDGLEDAMFGDSGLKLYDIMVLDEPGEEVLDVMLIHCDILLGNQERMHMPEEGSRMK